LPQLVRQSGLAVWAQIAAALRGEIERRLDEGDWLAPEPGLDFSDEDEDIDTSAVDLKI